MSKITLDLSNEERFEDNTFTIDKNITFIFGKNGTGKTTLTNLLKDNVTDYEVSVFQGFETVVGESKMLDAVILGKDNVEIDKKIAEKNVEIDKIQSDVTELETNVTEQAGKPNNLWSRHQQKEVKFKQQKAKIEEFYSESAAKIKNETDPQIAKPTYYKSDFEKEIKEAKYLTETEIEQMEKTVNVTEKKASYLPKISLNLEEHLKEMNELLCRKVSAQVVIEEFANNKDKETFAEIGFKLHNANDKCSFCGNVLSEERYDKLTLYFSADEVESFRGELSKFISKIESELKKIKDIDIDVNSFYPEKTIEAENIRSNLLERKTELASFLNDLKEKAKNKQKYLYESLELLKRDIPESMDLIMQKYDTLVEENNLNSLSEKKEIAKTKLRCHIIKTLLEEFGYEAEIVRKDELEKAARESNKDLVDELNIIESRRKEIMDKEDEIKELVRSTKNEKILADEINEKLKLYVNFELVHMQDKDEKGFYQIKCKRTSEIRSVDELSTGEKNIIAFLYFLEKLKEVKAGNSKPKLIIFDDPMNSNDDTMQYVIIEELKKLMDTVKEDNKFVLLTHNTHFYLNVKYGVGYKKNSFVRLNFSGKNIVFQFIGCEEDDFKTSYEALWKDLEIMYGCPVLSDGMLLNQIRRIIDTFTQFNCTKSVDMLSNVSGAKKMLDVNSHSIDDLAANLSAQEKEDIIKMFQECFKGVNAEKHFENHCKIKIV